MQAVKITSPGGPEVLQLNEVQRPAIEPNEVLIKVKAAGVNRPDVAQRLGRYPAPEGAPADIPGLEVSGTIEAVGDQVTRWDEGDEVCALVAGGGYAEYVNVPAIQCLPKPSGFTFVEAAAIPETYFTVWNNVFDLARFKKGDQVLVHGGTSGIGVATIQLVTAMGGTVYATAGSDEKCSFAEHLGAELCVNYKTQDFEEELKVVGGIDIILDMIGGEYANKNINLLNVEGRMVIINAMNGRMAEVDLMKIMVKRLTITGSTLRARSPEFKGAIAEKLEENIWPLLNEAAFRPIVHETFPLAEAADAHRLIESSEHMGKIVLTINS